MMSMIPRVEDPEETIWSHLPALKQDPWWDQGKLSRDLSSLWRPLSTLSSHRECRPQARASNHLGPIVPILQMEVSTLHDSQSRTQRGVGWAPFVHIAPQIPLSTHRHLTKAGVNRDFGLGTDFTLSLYFPEGRLEMSNTIAGT